ncbi:MAG: hypothetical protein EHM41_10755 [Chloroflexi bacterium]|nr:MAG: hypothetical protein EHM41_10755 [Chloroflexota bacterium]
MNRRYLAWIAWLASGIVTLFSLYNIGHYLLVLETPISPVRLAGDLLWRLFPIVFAIPGALIVSQQPRNTIGWLLLVPGILVGLPFPPEYVNVSQPPASPSFLFLLTIWFDNWSWLLLVFPILLIPLLFPNGRPPTPRWRWVLHLAAVMFGFFLLLITFSETLTPLNDEVEWFVENPIGFISSQELIENIVIYPWMVGLFVLTISSVAALFARFRNASAVERRQIKWLLYACGIFGVVYSFNLAVGGNPGPLFDIADMLFVLSMMTLPITIAVAILRHRLFDIDIIIRKTLIYALITGMLALTYFGSVVILQTLFTLLMGEQSTLAIVISTLAIAALFTPLRRRVQSLIDWRFYRQKYDTEKVLTAFARRIRDETNLDALSTDLLGIVSETMQPESVSLWMFSTNEEFHPQRENI